MNGGMKNMNNLELIDEVKKTLEFEGATLTEETIKLLEQYLNDEITAEQVRQKIIQRYDNTK